MHMVKCIICNKSTWRQAVAVLETEIKGGLFGAERRKIFWTPSLMINALLFLAYELPLCSTCPPLWH